MKISMSYWCLPGGLDGSKPILEAMQAAKDLGFDAIELAIAGQGALTPNTTREECKAIVAQAKKLDLAIASLASGQNWSTSPASSDKQVRKQCIEFTQKALRIAHWLGTDAFLFVPGSVDVFFQPDAEVVSYEVAYRRNLKTIRKLLPSAEKAKVAIAVENVWNKILLSPLEMKRFIDSFGSEYVGSYFDVGNILRTGYPDQWIRILGKRIKRIHVKDFKNSVGTAAGFCDLLEGDVDFEAVKQALSDIHYDSYITAEVMPDFGNLDKTAKAMKQIFK
jgi:L-ribulose-5-phosphate 3-epimerase